MWQYHIALGCLKSLKSLIPFFVEHVLTSCFFFFQNVRLELQYYPCSPISQRLKRMPHNLPCCGRQTGEVFAMHLVGSQAATSLVLLRIVNNRASLKRKAGSFLWIGNDASPDWWFLSLPCLPSPLAGHRERKRAGWVHKGGLAPKSIDSFWCHERKLAMHFLGLHFTIIPLTKRQGRG